MPFRDGVSTSRFVSPTPRATNALASRVMPNTFHGHHPTSSSQRTFLDPLFGGGIPFRAKGPARTYASCAAESVHARRPCGLLKRRRDGVEAPIEA